MDIHSHILPFLWVHGEDEATYRKMVGVIYDANIRAFCVEARPHKNFCKEQWWEDMTIILDEAEKRRMQVWILDDKHFPTGYANGMAEEAPLKLRRQGLLHKRFPVKGGKVHIDLAKHAHPPMLKSQMYLITDILNKNLTKPNRFSDDMLLGAAAIRLDRKDAPIDLKARITKGVLDWTAPEGQWEIHLCYLSRNIGTHRSYINMMDRESCRIQIDAVYEPHYQHFGDKFGTVIAGFFSDEPELGNNSMYKMYNLLGTEQDLPWSRELESALRERLGDGYAALLPLLWSNHCDPHLTAKVRYAFMDSVSHLVEEDFSHQIGAWCRAHGVEYIGHVVEDNNQHARTGTSLGHYFRGLKWQSMAGIDDIGGQVEPGGEDKEKKNILGYKDDGEFYQYSLAKLGSSLGALNPNMQGRAMCEIFGNYGWKEGVRLEKYLLDHFMVRGINYFVPHAFTCSAYPEKDCPPHFYAQGNNPQYRYFGELMKYADRVTKLISGGKAAAPVAILYHAEAEWCGKSMLMQKPARVLQDNQIDFHFVPADVFAERDFYKTEISDALTVNGHRHEALVIPYAQFITEETAEAVCELTERGGNVLFIDAFPDGLCTGEPLPERVKAARVVPLSKLLSEVESFRTLRLTPASQRIRAMHYVGDKECFYLVNEGDKPWRGSVELPVEGEFFLYDAWHDRSMAWDGGELTIAPCHSLLLMRGKPENAYAPPAFSRKKSLVQFEQSVCRAIDYPKFGEPRRINVLESYAKTDPKFSGVIRYETSFQGKAQALEITEAYEGVEVFVNRQSAGIQVVAPFVYDLRSLCCEGKNTLTIEVATTLERERGNTKKSAPTGITGEINLLL